MGPSKFRPYIRDGLTSGDLICTYKQGLQGLFCRLLAQIDWDFLNVCMIFFHRGVETFGHVTSRQLNLASLMNVEKCAEAVKAEERRIDLLVLNAGMYRKPRIEATWHDCSRQITNFAFLR